MKQWVQHKSEQGEKWECDTLGHGRYTWRVKAKQREGQDFQYLYLPKDEYLEVPGPERWVDVTGDVEYRDGNWLHAGLYHDGHQLNGKDYRLRRVEVNLVGPGIPNGCQKQTAFIVEKREP